jgi:hypothetical protein
VQTIAPSPLLTKYDWCSAAGYLSIILAKIFIADEDPPASPKTIVAQSACQSSRRIDPEALKEENGRSAARKRPIAIRLVLFQDLRAFPSTPVDYSYDVRYYDIGADHLPVSSRGKQSRGKRQILLSNRLAGLTHAMAR